MPASHALLGGSNAHRWLHCTPSAKAEAGAPDTAGEAAAEGTAAHALAEWKLLDWIDTPNAGPRPTSMWDGPDMEAHTDAYQAFVIEQAPPGALLWVESRLDFSQWVPGGYGTGDAVIISDDTIHVIDLKYGKGVEVDATENPQLSLYGLGAFHATSLLYDIATVKLSVFQPRRGHVSTWETSTEKLLDWGDHVVRPAARLAAAGEGRYRAGDWCRFCKIRATCRTRAVKNLELVTMDFADPARLSPVEIGEILAIAADLKTWVGDVEKYALAEATDRDTVFPGWKLVAGRSTRSYVSEDAAATALRKAKYKVADIYQPRRLLGITAMEKMLGPQIFQEVLGPHVAKPPGKPVLVPETDKRPALAVSRATDDFTPIEKEDNQL